MKQLPAAAAAGNKVDGDSEPAQENADEQKEVLLSLKKREKQYLWSFKS